MTLQEAIEMTPEQFMAACENARVDYASYESINTNTETLADAIDGFAQFQLTPESVKAIHAAGTMIP